MGRAGLMRGNQVVAGGRAAGPSLRLASPRSEAPPPMLTSTENICERRSRD